MVLFPLSLAARLRRTSLLTWVENQGRTAWRKTKMMRRRWKKITRMRRKSQAKRRKRWRAGCRQPRRREAEVKGAQGREMSTWRAWSEAYSRRVSWRGQSCPALNGVGGWVLHFHSILTTHNHWLCMNRLWIVYVSSQACQDPFCGFRTAWTEQQMTVRRMVRKPNETSLLKIHKT